MPSFKIAHVVPAPVGLRDGVLFSVIPSVRMRCLSIIPALVKLGIGGRLIHGDYLPRALQAGLLSDCSLVIIHKPHLGQRRCMELLRAHRVPTILDICDGALIGHADFLLGSVAITTSSPGLARMTAQRIARPVWFVPDAVEGEAGSPLDPDPPPRLSGVWFGFRKNIEPLIRLLAGSPARHAALERLEIVTDEATSLTDLVASTAPGLPVVFTEWTPETQAAALRRAHIALLPRSPGTLRATTSSNRLQQCLWSARIPVCSPFEGFEEFQQHAIITDDILEDTAAVPARWGALREAVNAGQIWASRTFTPDALAGTWADVIVSTTENARRVIN